MSRLILIGAGGLAREVLAVEKDLGRYDEVVILDDDLARWGSEIDGVRIQGPVRHAADWRGDLVVCAGAGSVRRRIVRRLGELGVDCDRYAVVQHPTVSVASSCVVGAGSVLLAGTVLTAGIRVGRHVVAMPNVVLTHDDDVSDFATLCAGVTVGGRVLVGESAYLGMSSSVRQDLTVGADSTLGMGAVLLTDLPPGQTWAGVPARRIHQEIS